MARSKKRNQRTDPPSKQKSPTYADGFVSNVDDIPHSHSLVDDSGNEVKLATDDEHLPSNPDLLDDNHIESDLATEISDILGNGLLLKKTLEKGSGEETRPGHGDCVDISFKGWLEDGTLFDNIDSLTIIIGDGDVIQALELALPITELHERFELSTDPRFAFGSRGREPDIPPNAKLRYEVQLLSVRDPPCYRAMSTVERVKVADEKRERGNWYYRREEYAFAVNSYNKALKILTAPMENIASGDACGDATATPEVAQQLEIKLQNNLAATQLKIQAYDAAIKSCDAVLLKDPGNFKALFRKGKALVEQGDTDEAVQILSLVHDMVPSSSMVSHELQRALSAQRKERDRWARAASRMFPHAKQPTIPRERGFLRIRSILISRWSIVFTTLLFALLSVGFAWYSDILPKNSALRDWIA